MKFFNLLLVVLGMSFYSCSKKNKDLDGAEDPAGIEMSDSGEWDEFSDDFDAVAEDFDSEFGDEFAGDDDFAASDDFGDQSYAAADDGDFAVDDFGSDDFADAGAVGDGFADDYAGDAFADSGAGGVGAVAITPTGDEEIYTVEANDTLMLIAFKLYGDYSRWREIAQLNQDVLGGGSQITSGMQLRYSSSGAGFSWDPQGNPYLIQYGDTLGLISGKVYGNQGRWRDIWNNNKPLIKDPNRIYAGFTIYYIPDDNRDVASQNFETEADPVIDDAPAFDDSFDDGFDDLDFGDDF